MLDSLEAMSEIHALENQMKQGTLAERHAATLQMEGVIAASAYLEGKLLAKAESTEYAIAAGTYLYAKTVLDMKMKG